MTPVTGFSPADSRTEALAPLYGLGGKLRAGKDAVGDYLEANHAFTKLGMSDALNEALLALNPIIPTGKYWESGYEHYMTYQDYHAAHGYVEAKKNPEVRRLLQALGTEVGRNMIDPDVWVNIAEAKIQALRSQGIPVVITAVRFPNEIEMIRRLGGTTVWIHRAEQARTDAGEAITQHASETSVDAYDFEYVISNNGTLDDLYVKVENVLDNVKQGKHSGGVVPTPTSIGNRIIL